MASIDSEWGVQVKLVGFDGLTARLKKGGKAAREEISRVVGDTAARLHQRTVDLCPKDTFYMSEHVRTDFTKSGLAFEVGWDASDFIGRKNPANGKVIEAFYPFYVEFGTRKMAAQPSLSIAYRELVPSYVRALDAALKRALEK